LRTIVFEICIALVALAGFGVGYLLWDRTSAHYAADFSQIGFGPENDLVRYGRQLVINTPGYIGRSAQEPAMAFGGNDLSCQSCHLQGGLQRFAAPFVSTAATFPMMVNNKVITLPDRINSCMVLGLNGRPLPQESREMAALIAYIGFLGKGTPEGVRLPGMGLLPIQLPEKLPDARRGVAVYSQHCLSCHGADGQGEPKQPPEVGYYVPPLWGEDSFNGGAGMGQIAYAASYIRATMPPGTDYQAPVLSVQEAWDVAAFMIANPHPIAPPEIETVPLPTETPVDSDQAAEFP
jgi:thiosulfate dehydrogenase